MRAPDTAPLDLHEGARLDDVIGMWSVRRRLERTVLAPIDAALAGHPGVHVPRGVLVHGPEGCGVSFVARCLAGDLGDRGVDVHLVEGIDELGERGRNVAGRLFDGATTVVVAASHAPQALDASLLGAGRFDRLVFVHPPDWDARRFRVWQTLTALGRDPELLEPVLAATEGWTGRDLDAVLSASDARPVLDRIAQHEPAAAAWLREVRPLAVHRAAHGLVDDLVAYLERLRLR